METGAFIKQLCGTAITSLTTFVIISHLRKTKKKWKTIDDFEEVKKVIMNSSTDNSFSFGWDNGYTSPQSTPMSSTPNSDYCGEESSCCFETSSPGWVADFQAATAAAAAASAAAAATASATASIRTNGGGVEFARTAWRWTRSRNDSVESESTTLSSSPPLTNFDDSFCLSPPPAQRSVEEFPWFGNLGGRDGGSTGLLGEDNTCNCKLGNETALSGDQPMDCTHLDLCFTGSQTLNEQFFGQLRHQQDQFCAVSNGWHSFSLDNTTGYVLTNLTNVTTNKGRSLDLYCSESDTDFISEDDKGKDGSFSKQQTPEQQQHHHQQQQHAKRRTELLDKSVTVFTKNDEPPHRYPDCYLQRQLSEEEMTSLDVAAAEIREAATLPVSSSSLSSVPVGSCPTTIIKPIIIKPIITKIIPVFIRAKPDRDSPQSLPRSLADDDRSKEVSAGSGPLSSSPGNRSHSPTVMTDSETSPETQEVTSDSTPKSPKQSRTTVSRETRRELRRHNANVRERDRIQRLSAAFDQLRRKLPRVKCTLKPVSKVEILRGAIDYIQLLQGILGGDTSKKKSPNPKSKSGSLLTSRLLARKSRLLQNKVAAAQEAQPSNKVQTFPSPPKKAGQLTVWPRDVIATSFQ